MNNSELFSYRNQLIRDSMAFKKTDRIAHISNFWLWKVHDAGLTISEALADGSKMQKAVTEHQEKYNFDMIIDYGFRGPGALYHFLEGDCFVVDDEKGFLSIKDDPIFDLSDYDLLIKDFGKLIWEVALPRKFARLRRHMGMEDYGQILNLYGASGNYLMSIGNVMKEQFGLPSIPMTSAAMSGLEILGGGRGIKGLATDLRRDLGKVKAAVDVIDSMFMDQTVNLLNSLPAGPDMENPMDSMSTMMFHTILNQKQWEAVYWPSLKKVLDTAVKTNKQVYLFVEGSILRFADYFSDYPKGTIAIHNETDDLFELRKRLPNVCLVGGMPTSLLGGGTEQQCVDYAKKLIDELGRDGGFMLSQDKMVSYRDDCKSANLAAVSKFVQEYKR